MSVTPLMRQASTIEEDQEENHLPSGNGAWQQGQKERTFLLNLCQVCFAEIETK